jgi:D-alanine-D-alanine ligase
MPDELDRRIRHISRRVVKVLQINGFARVDLRLTEDGRVYVLEANPNPQIARLEDFARSAECVGYSYPQLLQRILSLGLSWQPDRAG